LLGRISPSRPGASQRSCPSAAAWKVRAAVGAERLEAGAHLGRRLVGEGHRQNPLGREGAAGHLPGDPARDRRRLTRARAGKDADRSARLQDGALLLGVEPVEYPLRPHGDKLAAEL
jgi:hypothetical protein